MGKRKRHAKQASMWVATQDLPRSAAHPFYARLNQILDQHDFDRLCRRSLRAVLCGRGPAGPAAGPLLPIAADRLLRRVGRGARDRVAGGRFVCRCASFCGLVLPEAPPDHSTISRTRRLIDLETHEAVFTWMLQRLADAGLVKGKTIGIDATTLEANAALRSIVRRDTGESYQDFLTKLAQASGIETPTRADLARHRSEAEEEGLERRLDASARSRREDHQDERRAHASWRTRPSMRSTSRPARSSPSPCRMPTTATRRRCVETLIEAAEQMEAVRPDGEGHRRDRRRQGLSQQSVARGSRSRGSPHLHLRARSRADGTGRRSPTARDAVYRNRRRIRGARGLRLLRRRGERLERPFAHLYETGGMRRVHLRGHTNILKRVLIHAGGFNLGLLMRQLIGVGTPRGLQGRLLAVLATLLTLIWPLRQSVSRHRSLVRLFSRLGRLSSTRSAIAHIGVRETAFTTGCSLH